MTEIDFDKLNDSLYAWTCKCEGCDRKVASPNGYCMGCFMGHLTGYCADDHPVPNKEEEA